MDAGSLAQHCVSGISDEAEGGERQAASSRQHADEEDMMFVKRSAFHSSHSAHSAHTANLPSHYILPTIFCHLHIPIRSCPHTIHLRAARLRYALARSLDSHLSQTDAPHIHDLLLISESSLSNLAAISPPEQTESHPAHETKARPTLAPFPLVSFSLLWIRSLPCHALREEPRAQCPKNAVRDPPSVREFPNALRASA